MTAFQDMIAKLEPEAVRAEAYDSPEQGVLCSIAISLKRIADVMEQRNSYGEQGAEAIGNSIVRGLRGIQP